MIHPHMLVSKKDNRSHKQSTACSSLPITNSSVPTPGNRAFGLRTDSGLTAFPLSKAKKRLLGNFGSLVVFYRLLYRWPEAQARAARSPLWWLIPDRRLEKAVAS